VRGKASRNKPSWGFRKKSLGDKEGGSRGGSVWGSRRIIEKDREICNPKHNILTSSSVITPGKREKREGHAVLGPIPSRFSPKETWKEKRGRKGIRDRGSNRRGGSMEKKAL